MLAQRPGSRQAETIPAAFPVQPVDVEISPAIIVVDTETTSLSVSTARILEIAAVVVVLDEVVSTWSSLVHADVRALAGAEDALRINHIHVEELELAPPEPVVKDMWASLLKAFPGARLTAFNVGYDRPVLERGRWLSRPWADCVMLRAKSVMGAAGALPMNPKYGDYRWPKLQEAAAFFKVDQVGAHRALADALTAARVMIAMDRRTEP